MQQPKLPDIHASTTRGVCVASDYRLGNALAGTAAEVKGKMKLPGNKYEACFKKRTLPHTRFNYLLETAVNLVKDCQNRGFVGVPFGGVWSLICFQRGPATGYGSFLFCFV